jgi:hypothetical protein
LHLERNSLNHTQGFFKGRTADIESIKNSLNHTQGLVKKREEIFYLHQNLSNIMQGLSSFGVDIGLERIKFIP